MMTTLSLGERLAYSLSQSASESSFHYSSVSSKFSSSASSSVAASAVPVKNGSTRTASTTITPAAPLPQHAGSYESIPRFYVKPQSSESIQKLAFARKIEMQRQLILTNEELDQLWDALCEHGSAGTEDERKLTYDDYLNIKSLLPSKFHRFFQASTFLRFVPDQDGNISVMQFFNYVLRKVSLMQARLDLSVYDQDRDGYLTEEELQNYIGDLIPSLNLENVDPSKRGRIPIQDILLSPILTELFELREPELPKEYERTNWFSSYSTLRVYGQFLNLDVDHNGMLSRKELSKFNSSTLTDVYLDRIFQECRTHKGELDYKGFLDLVLAHENTSSPEAIAFGFKLLDINNKGYLDEFTIRFLFKAVVEKMVTFGHEPVGIDDVTNEIFDMINPAVPERITLADLQRCGVGGTIFTILSDCRGFWAYDNRENMEASSK